MNVGVVKLLVGNVEFEVVDIVIVRIVEIFGIDLVFGC